MHTPFKPVFSLTLALLAGGCESTPQSATPDASASEVGAIADAAQTDAPRADLQPLTDSSHDLGVADILDASVPTDTAPSMDLALLDAPMALDTSPTTDAPLPVDAPSPVDTPSPADAPSPVDVGSIPDGRVTSASEGFIGSEGGTLALDEVTLTVPPGALADSVEISIVHTADRAEGAEFMTSNYALLPEGLTFQLPVTVRFNLPTTPPSTATVNWSDRMDPDRLRPVTTTVSGNTLSASNTHFSILAVTPGPVCMTAVCRARSELVGIQVTPATPHLRVGGSTTLAAMGVYADRRVRALPMSPMWLHGVPGVASVNSSGTVQGVSIGRGTIFATLGTLSGSATVVVAPAFRGSMGFNGAVLALASQPLTGLLYAGGNFGEYEGARTLRIARVLPSGLFDTAFATGDGFDNTIHAIALGPSNEVYVGGNFGAYIHTPGMPVSWDSLIRLTPSGAIDPGFARPPLTGRVRSVLPGPGGTVYVGGDLVIPGRSARVGLVRLTSVGALDPAFTIDTDIDGGVYALALAPDGSGDLYVGGFFNTYLGAPHHFLVRLNPNGTVDTSFASSTPPGGRPGVILDGGVTALAAAIDGSNDLYVGGAFDRYFDARVGRGLLRLNNDGTRDAVFNTGPGLSTTGRVNALLVTADGVYVGGQFTSYRGRSSSNIVRVNGNGTVDTRFDVGAGFGGASDAEVSALAAAPGGDIYAGGYFGRSRGVTVNNIARLSNLGGPL